MNWFVAANQFHVCVGRRVGHYFYLDGIEIPGSDLIFVVTDDLECRTYALVDGVFMDTRYHPYSRFIIWSSKPDEAYQNVMRLAVEEFKSYLSQL